jgi:restriction endonuclease Mrr
VADHYPKRLPIDLVSGLAKGETTAFEYVLAFAKHLVLIETDTKTLLPDDHADLTYGALVDVLTAVQSGKCRTPGNVRRVAKESIRRASNKYDTEHQLSLGANALNKLDGELFGDVETFETVEVQDEVRPVQLYSESDTEPRRADVRADLLAFDDELIRFLASHPEHMYKLSPRRFEEVVAAILKDLGYAIELTAAGADGGVDIFATQKSAIGEVLLVVDCKRYSRHKHVGVEIVRALYGIGEQKRATMAMLATTSFFTRPAQEFQRAVRNRLSLQDYDGLLNWLRPYHR